MPWNSIHIQFKYGVKGIRRYLGFQYGWLLTNTAKSQSDWPNRRQGCQGCYIVTSGPEVSTYRKYENPKSSLVRSKSYYPFIESIIFIFIMFLPLQLVACPGFLLRTLKHP